MQSLTDKTSQTEDQELVINARTFNESWMPEAEDLIASDHKKKLTTILNEYQISKTLSVESRALLARIKMMCIETKLSDCFLSFANFFQKNFQTFLQMDHTQNI